MHTVQNYELRKLSK